jgi:single-strand DNA-binding protein
MNKVILTGTVGKDTSHTQKTVAIASFPFATQEMVKKGDSYENQTEWHNIKAFGKLADKAKDFHKGDYLEITGKIKTSQYQNQEGVKVSVTEIIADSLKRIRKAEVKEVKKEMPQPTQSRDISEDIYSDTNTQGDLPF